MQEENCGLRKQKEVLESFHTSNYKELKQEFISHIIKKITGFKQFCRQFRNVTGSHQLKCDELEEDITKYTLMSKRLNTIKTNTADDVTPCNYDRQGSFLEIDQLEMNIQKYKESYHQ